MPLFAWFPLDGDLHNQGLDSITITATNYSFTDDGKIGKCCNLGYSSNFTVPSLVNGKQISIAYWVRINTATSTQWLDPIHYYTNSGSNFVNRQEFYSNCTRTGIWFDNGSISNIPVTVGEWMHFVITADYITGVVKFYKDGELKGTATTGNTATVITGTSFRLGESGLDLSENDVRIYNHILQPKEISEIYKGLVLHYTLDGYRSGANIASGTNTASTSTNALAFSEQAGGSTREIEYDEGVPCIKIIRNSTAHSGWSYLRYGSINRSLLKPSTSYVLSMDVIASGSGKISFSALLNSNGTKPLTSSVTVVSNSFNSETWSHLVYRTTTIDSFEGVMDNQVIYMRCSYLTNTDVWLKAKNIKLEEGTIDTPWMPYSGDAAYTKMGYDSTTEFDSSGYLHNAVRTGTFTWSQSSPRYLLSTNFSGSNYLEADPLPASTQTISVWLKTTWSSSSGYNLAVHDKNTGLAIGWSAANLITYVGTSNGGTGSQIPTSGKFIANQWNHVVVVKTGSNTRTVYINGEVASASGKNYWGGDMLKLHVGGRHISGNYAGFFNGQISDLRVYAKQLTAQEVKELYTVSASITDNGRFLAYNFIEK